MERKLGTLCVTAALAACALTTGAQAATVASITPAFAPARLGASTAFSLAIQYSNQGGGVPEPVTHAVVHLPAGLGIEVRAAGICPKSKLEKQSGQGCPASARVGRGSALMGAHLGAIDLHENAALSAWRGPNQGGHPTLEILGEGLSPLEERVVVTGVLEADHAPYGQRLTMSVPPIPTLPTEPNASVLHFSLTVGAGHGRLGRLIHVPSKCPAGGFRFGADFAYADSTSSSTTAVVHCP
ncbi:MAG TPA: hypothetical protein VGY76_06680 [Solirubrobacteraceae bacterium]|nr:hypothetical protein [Solirubrobacteraceae bacterium]